MSAPVAASGRRYVVTFPERTFVMSIVTAPDGTLAATIDGATVALSAAALEGTSTFSLIVDGASFEVGVAPSDEGGWIASLGGHLYGATIVDEALARFVRSDGVGRPTSGREVIRAPMPGLVVALPAAPGAVVGAGAPVVVLEAMKMQNELTSRHGGRVESVHVAIGDKVEKGQTLSVVVT